MRITLCIALLSVGFVGGCTSDDYVRTEGVTPAAGNAQAANTAMQMVDPWQYGVQNTKLKVPAQRPVAAADQAVGAKAGQTAAAPSTTD